MPATTTLNNANQGITLNPVNKAKLNEKLNASPKDIPSPALPICRACNDVIRSVVMSSGLSVVMLSGLSVVMLSGLSVVSFQVCL